MNLDKFSLVDLGLILQALRFIDVPAPDVGKLEVQRAKELAAVLTSYSMERINNPPL